MEDSPYPATLLLLPPPSHFMESSSKGAATIARKSARGREREFVKTNFREREGEGRGGERE
jgi:hypothetical protein